MSDLVTWLRQQLEEVEADLLAGLDAWAIANADWAETRELAWVTVKRAILDDHDPDWPRRECPRCCGYDGNDNYGREIRPREAYPCRVVRLLAVPYSDRPDYDETWRPAVVAPSP